MKSFNEIVAQYTVKKDREIKKICSPLENFFQDPIFTYHSVEEDGKFVVLSNYPEQLDFYYSEQLYLENPFFIHPSLLRSGFAFVPAVIDDKYSKISRDKYHVDNLLILVERQINKAEIFVFGAPLMNKDNLTHSLKYLNEFQLFTKYFKQQAKPLIEKVKKDQFNIKEVRKSEFFKVSSNLPLGNQPEVAEFSKSVLPLSPRELQCLEFFKQGKSAQATGAILNLSSRTVEFYFTNIKKKLKCSSKYDLLGR